MPRQPKARSLSIFLMKTQRPRVEEIIAGPAALTIYPVRVSGHSIGDLYVQATADKMPSWLSLFDGTVGAMPDLHNASSAAVFILPVAERTFVLTFGYGRSLLRPGTWEEDFGLRVTLNAVDPLRIRSVDRVKFDSISQHSQIQASRDANIVDFGLDVEQDLLRAVTGKPRDLTLATQLTGKDALKADVKISLGELPALLARFADIFGQEVYKEHFAWVDHVNEVKDPTVVEQLNALLVQKIETQDFERLWLAVPDRVDWEGMAGFKYRENHRAELYPDIHFRTFLEDAGPRFVPSIETLKNRRRIYLVSHEADLPVAAWPVYRCIYCEIESANETHLLNNGKWYRVSPDFLNNVNTSFAQIAQENAAFPLYAHADEGAYNTFAAEQMPDRLCLMDEKFVRYPTARDTVEFCDLYSLQRQIVHVKRYRGSATLSHLFSQAVVSAELFCVASEFRDGVNAHLLAPFRIIDTHQRPQNEEYEVVFAIISKSARPLTLPFFSRVNLRNAVQRLKALGYRVSITKIQAG